MSEPDPAMAEERRQPYIAMSEADWHEPAVEPGGGRPQPRESVGRLLRRTREYYGHDLRQIADTLRIRYAYLHAIEQSHFDDLPGPTYAVGFVRSYADYLGLDDDEVVRRFKDEVEGLDRHTQLHFPEPVNEGKIPGGAILLVSALLIAVAYGGWYYMSSQGKGVADLIPAVPERLQAVVSGGGDDEAEPEVAEPAAEPEPPTVARATEEPADEPAPAEPETATAGEPEPQVAAAPRDEPETATLPESDNGAGGEAALQTASETPEPPSESGVPTAAEIAASIEEAEAPASESEVAAMPEPEADELPEPSVVHEPGTTAADEAEASAEIPAASAGGDSEPADAEVGATQQAVAPAAEEPVAAEQPAEATGSGIPAAPSADSDSGTGDGRVYGASNENARIVLQADQDSWVQVRDADDNLLLTRVLRTGDVYRVPDRGGLTLLTGNAGGLTVLVDDQPVPSLGPSGAVRRGIELDPAKLRQGLAQSN